jgi:predicted nucleic acid-binding protein
MPSQLLVDTDVFIDFLRGYHEAVKYVSNNAEDIVISVISTAELYARVKGDKEKQELRMFLNLFPVLEVTEEIAQIAGLYKKEFFKSHNLGLADALIAATAFIHGLNLITLNCKDFPMFKDLEPPYRKVDPIV